MKKHEGHRHGISHRKTRVILADTEETRRGNKSIFLGLALILVVILFVKMLIYFSRLILIV